MAKSEHSSQRCVLLFTKPANPGRVKTRLIGELTAQQAAAIHAALLGDLSERLEPGDFHLWTAWALSDGEAIPYGLVPPGGNHVVQSAGDLGDRLTAGLAMAAEEFAAVGAVGSDHPELEATAVEDAFQQLERGADVVFGPTVDGGYYFVGLRREAVRPELFAGIPWSTSAVLDASLERCRELGFEVALLPTGHDIDFAADLRQLAARLSLTKGDCPRTRALLTDWGWLLSSGGAP